MAGLRARVTSLRATVGEIGFPQRTPRQAEALLERIERLAADLGDPEFKLPPSRLQDLDVDPSSLAGTLVPEVDVLRQALDELRHQESEVTAAEQARDRALAEFNQTFLKTAGTIESFLRMADLDDLADRVRPSKRCPGLTAIRPGQERT